MEREPAMDGAQTSRSLLAKINTQSQPAKERRDRPVRGGGCIVWLVQRRLPHQSWREQLHQTSEVSVPSGGIIRKISADRASCHREIQTCGLDGELRITLTQRIKHPVRRQGAGVLRRRSSRPMGTVSH
jgi:hypothetical protein